MKLPLRTLTTGAAIVVGTVVACRPMPPHTPRDYCLAGDQLCHPCPNGDRCPNDYDCAYDGRSCVLHVDPTINPMGKARDAGGDQ